jgi:hypothetical protein
MRFSIRSLFAATAYLALATAAIATGSELLADLIWAISILTICFAFVLACIARKQKQAIALGFALLASAHVVGLYWFPARLPSMRLFSALGYIVYDTGEVFEIDPTTPPARGAYREVKGIEPAIQTANAIGALAAGLIGCLIGQLAYRYGSSDGNGRNPVREE